MARLLAIALGINSQLGAIPSGEGVPFEGSGRIQGYTDAGEPATSPANLSVTFSSPALSEAQGGALTVTVNTNAESRVFTFSNTDPDDGTSWINTETMVSSGEMATQLALSITDWALSNLSASEVGDVVTVEYVATGATATLGGDTSSGNISVAGGGTGTDGTAPSGDIPNVELVAANGDWLRVTEIEVSSESGVNNAFNLTYSNDDSIIRDYSSPPYPSGDIDIDDTLEVDATGPDASIVLAFTDSLSMEETVDVIVRGFRYSSQP
jgi:hypothetical protein